MVSAGLAETLSAVFYCRARLGVLPDSSKWPRADTVFTGACLPWVWSLSPPLSEAREPGAGKRLLQKAGRASVPGKECAGGNSQGHPAGLPGGTCAHSQ